MTPNPAGSSGAAERSADQLGRRCLLALLAFAALWAGIQWHVGRPEAVVGDWMGWRQADTQSIAVNFFHNGHRLLTPQINWGGAGEGVVEAELQLLPWLESGLFHVTGAAEWPGQALALLCMTAGGLLVFACLRLYFGGVAALLGALVVYTSLGTIHLATSIQPDPLSFVLYCAHLYCFLRYLVGANRSWLIPACLLATLSVLVKPTALQLGVFQFATILLVQPRLLRDPFVWLNWVVILACLALYMSSSHALYLAHGNTFGVGLAGDSKFPTLEKLLDPGLIYATARISMTWGITYVGALALVVLALGRKVSGIEVALATATAMMLLVSLRYSSSVWFGSHYHVLTVVLGAWAVAHCAELIGEVLVRRVEEGVLAALGPNLLIVGALCLALAVTIVQTRRRADHPDTDLGRDYVALGNALGEVVAPGEKVVVRAPASRYVADEWGGGENNYQDPRIFYQARTTGWSLAKDDTNFDEMNRFAGLGARYYVHPTYVKKSDGLDDWLGRHASLVEQLDGGEIYELHGFEKP